MSDNTTQLLAAFDLLPAKEQHEVLIAMLKRSNELPNICLNDDHLVLLADELFQTLDQEESNAHNSEQG